MTVTKMSTTTHVQVADAYQARKLDAIFQLWDTNRNGKISFRELCQGLYR